MRCSFLICFSFLLLLAGCNRSHQQSIVLYTSVDEPIARPLINEFTKQTGIAVTLVTDTEASKSVGLAERLRAEKDHPQADVWWGNEPFHTINLAEEGLLSPYNSPNSKEIADQFKDPQHRWTGNGLRVRVLVFSEAVVGSSERVYPPSKGVDRLTAITSGVCMALPTAGTTGGWVAALYSVWGEAKADYYFAALRRVGVKLVGGNSVVAEEVGRGTVSAGITDNDDAASAASEGGKLKMMLPDQDSFGTLALPTTVGLVTGAHNPEAAKKLIDFLLTKETEQKLIDVKFAMFSARADAHNDAKFMAVDYPSVARNMATSVRRATAILEGRE